MKQLIIAEKPSLGMSIVKALTRYGKFENKDGYLESEKFIVSFSYGHLFTLADIKDYDESKDKWSIENLPFNIENKNFKWQLKKDKKTKKTDIKILKQYNILKSLILRKDVEEIINCGDADLEGEVIIRLTINKVFNECNLKKTVKRMWAIDTTEDTIINAMKNLKLDSEYDSLFLEGIARHKIDWLLGINFTRYVSLKAGTLLRVGRVVVPIVKIIYDRDLEIKNFKSTKYFQIESNEITKNEKVKLIYKEKFNSIDDTINITKELNNNKAIVENLETKEVKKVPKKLFSLSKLQSELSKKYKYSIKESLDIIQKLYEKSLVTYPRTNSEYLSENEKNKVKNIINIFNKEDNNVFLKFKDNKNIFNDEKIESHSAIIPTGNLDLKNLNEKELNVYNVIKNRFISNFLLEETIIIENIMTININNYTFKLKGKSVKKEGFLKYEKEKIEGELLPNLSIGDEVNHLFKSVEKETLPPKKITTTTLLNALKNPFSNYEEELEDDYKSIIKGLQIGTEATRAGIIENAKLIGYINEKNSVYSITDKGIKFINSLYDLNINLWKERTIEFQKDLKDIYNKKTDVNSIINKINTYIYDTIKKGNEIKIDKIENFKENKEVIGICPRCGKNIYESKKNFYCEGFKDNPKCNFSVWKNNKFFESKGKKLTKSVMKNLLKKGESKVKGFKKKDSEETYDSIIVIKDTGKYINFEFKK